MSNANAIKSKIKNIRSKAKLQKFIYIVKQLRNDSNFNFEQLYVVSNEERRGIIARYLAWEKFDYDELKEIKEYVFKIDVPYRLILIGILVLAMCYIGYNFYHYNNLPRAYIIGNKIPVYDVKNEKIKYLDIYGESLDDSSISSSEDRAIYIKSDSDRIVVQNESFVNYLTGGAKNFYVNKDDVVLNIKEYQEFKEIFKQIKSTEFLKSLTTEDRKIIHHFIKSNNELANSILVNSVSKSDLNIGFKPVLPIEVNGQRIIFLCLRTAEGKFKNLKFENSGGSMQNLSEINYLNNVFNQPLVWKEEKTQGAPYVYYKDNLNNSYKGFAPPYDSNSFVKIPN